MLGFWTLVWACSIGGGGWYYLYIKSPICIGTSTAIMCHQCGRWVLGVWIGPGICHHANIFIHLDSTTRTFFIIILRLWLKLAISRNNSESASTSALSYVRMSTGVNGSKKKPPKGKMIDSWQERAQQRSSSTLAGSVRRSMN